MKNIKTKLAAIIMTGFLMAGTTFAKGGLLLSDLRGETQPQTCTQTNGGILVTTLTGILVTTFTGILVTTAIDTKSECGE